MEKLNLFIGIVLLILAAGVSSWGWWMVGKILERQIPPQGLAGIISFSAISILIGFGTYFIKSEFDMFFFVTWVFVITYSPILVYGIFHIFTTRPILIEKAQEGGKPYRISHAAIQLFLIGVLFILIVVIFRIGLVMWFG